MSNIWILAQAENSNPADVITSEPVTSENAVTSQDGSDGSGKEDLDPNAGKGQNPWSPLMLFLPIIIIMYFFMLRGPKKQQAQQQKMISSLKPNDRVQTIGGIFGTIISVKDDEIIIKIDESNNTKMRVAPSAIRKLASDDTN